MPTWAVARRSPFAYPFGWLEPFIVRCSATEAQKRREYNHKDKLQAPNGELKRVKDILTHPCARETTRTEANNARHI